MSSTVLGKPLERGLMVFQSGQDILIETNSFAICANKWCRSWTAMAIECACSPLTVLLVIGFWAMFVLP